MKYYILQVYFHIGTTLERKSHSNSLVHGIILTTVLVTLSLLSAESTLVITLKTDEFDTTATTVLI